MKQAAVCIIHDTQNPDYIHALRRTIHDKSAPGLFCFPGGKLDPGESFKDACIREVREETQFILSPDHMEHVTTVMIGECETAVFRCWKYEGGTYPTISSEHDSASKISWCHAECKPLFGPATWGILEEYRRLMSVTTYCDTVYPGVKDIVINELVRNTNPVETFEVNAKWYSGDADAYEITTALVPLCDKAKLIEVLDAICMAVSNDCTDDNILDWHPDHAALLSNNFIEWPMDVFHDGDRAQTLDGFEIFYYNNRGEKHTCKIVEL